MDEGRAGSPSIRAISKGVIHRICSGQVILDLSSAVKELVENSLDAGATCIEVMLKEHGEEYFKVTDNGCGISPDNFQSLALKHHTSKIADFGDLQFLTTFGFRGEALSSICALGKLTVETKTKNEPVGTRITFDHSGTIISEEKVARLVGTTVIVGKLFSTLPVRSKEFKRNIRREYGKLVSTLNAYALIAKGARLVCTNTTAKGSKSTVLKTQGTTSLKDNIINVFGLNTFSCLEPLSATLSEGCKVEGFLSRLGHGNGRNLGDRQFFYVNGRPVDMPRVSKLLNELYRSSNPKQYPIAILDFILPTKTCDVNVTPDKRKVFFSDESSLLLSLRETVESLYSPNQLSFPINDIEGPMKADSDSDALVELESPVSVYQNMEIQDVDMEDNLYLDKATQADNLEKGTPSISNKIGSLLSNPFQHGLCETKKPRSFLEYQESLTVNLSSPRAPTINQGQFCVKPSKKGSVEMASPPSRSSVVQSSLTKFVTVSKRKHESSCKLITELPLMRNKVQSCHGEKTCASPSVCLYDDDTATLHQIPKNAAETPKTNTLTIDIVKKSCYRKEEMLGELNRAADDLEELSSEDSDTLAKNPPRNFSSTVVDTLKPCSGRTAFSTLQFCTRDILTRRRHAISCLQSSKFKPQNKKSVRYYAAATLEKSAEECDENKERLLAAATTELERFFRKQDFARMKVVGQFNLGFIIGKLENDLFIIDQHAADEKYNFEQLSGSTILNQQPLLKPIRLELSPEEEVVTSMHMDIIRKNGFSLSEDIHAPPGSQFLLKAVPFSKNITFGVPDVKELISSLADTKGEYSSLSSYKMATLDSVCPSRVRYMLASRACRTSVMIGDSLSQNEMKKILQNLATLKSPWNCPHGRPTMRHLVDLSSVYSEAERNLFYF